MIVTYHIGIQVDSYDEVETCVPAVDHFVLPMLYKWTLILSARETFADEFSFKSDTFLYGEAVVVFWEAGLALLVDHEHELDHPK